MKYCPTCGKQLQYDTAEVCPGCGCRVSGPQKTGGVIGIDKIVVFFLVAIFIILCIIAFTLLSPSPKVSGTNSILPRTTLPATILPDNSFSGVWNTMDDWSEWEHTAAWSGEMVGSCTEYGPRIAQGHGEYGSLINLRGGSAESSVWRTFSDPSGEGWNTLTLVGRLSPSDVPSGRWMKIEVNNEIVYNSDAAHTPPGNGILFTIPVNFPQSEKVKVKISNGQKPAWGGTPLILEYYSIRLSNENNAVR
jgi:hypothetical protein